MHTIVCVIRDTKQAVQTSLMRQEGTDAKAAPGPALAGAGGVQGRAGLGLQEHGADRGSGTQGAGPVCPALVPVCEEHADFAGPSVTDLGRVVTKRDEASCLTAERVRI